MAKRTVETITNLLATAESTGEALKALTELAEAARHAAALGTQLQEAAATVENLIDRLAPCVGCTVEDVYAPLFRG
jgi:hypothetical protein